ncbi:MAG: hypothetical protein KC496_01695, partial [Anaerolineae bacterium]|nr:hypothetical protein [Anaerolineae bacterium]
MVRFFGYAHLTGMMANQVGQAQQIRPEGALFRQPKATLWVEHDQSLLHLRHPTHWPGTVSMGGAITPKRRFGHAPRGCTNLALRAAFCLLHGICQLDENPALAD